MTPPLTTPTGVYDIDTLTHLVYGIRRALHLPILDWEDLLQDLIVYLLEGSTLSQGCVKIRKKYKSWGNQVAYSAIPEIVIHDTVDKGNARILSDREKNSIRQKFYAKVDKLPVEDQHLVILRTFGYKHKEIAQIMDLNHSAVRKRMERIKRRLR